MPSCWHVTMILTGWLRFHSNVISNCTPTHVQSRIPVDTEKKGLKKRPFSSPFFKYLNNEFLEKEFFGVIFPYHSTSTQPTLSNGNNHSFTQLRVFQSLRYVLLPTKHPHCTASYTCERVCTSQPVVLRVYLSFLLDLFLLSFSCFFFCYLGANMLASLHWLGLGSFALPLHCRF